MSRNGCTINSSLTDMLGISALKSRLAQTGYILPQLTEQDKGPLWDGHLLIYKKPRMKNEDVFGKFSVQVKSTIKEEINVESTVYSLDKTILTAYIHNGGTVLFIVFLSEKNTSNSKIFYSALTPIKLSSLIKETESKGTKQAVIKCFPLPEDNDSIVSCMMNYFEDSRKQTSFVNDDCSVTAKQIDEDNSKAISFRTIAFGNNNNGKISLPLKSMSGQELYGYINQEGVNVPVNRVFKLSFKKKEHETIKVGNRVFYDSFQTEYKNGKAISSVGNHISAIVGKDTMSVTIDFNCGSLRNDLLDYEFALSVMENKGFSVGNRKISSKDFYDESLYKTIKAIVCAGKMLYSLNLNCDVDLSKLSQDEQHLLFAVSMGIVERCPVVFGEEKPKTWSVSFGDLHLVLAMILIDSSNYTYQVFNVFDNQIIAKNTDTGKLVLHYSLLRFEDYLEADNVQLDNLIPELEEIRNDCDDVHNLANMELLKLLLAYDASNDARIDCLRKAREISDWLAREVRGNGSEIIDLLNSLQITKRKRDYSPEEIETLNRIANDKKNNCQNRAAAYLLLEDKENSRKMITRMGPDSLLEFKTYPIYRFAKDIFNCNPLS